MAEHTKGDRFGGAREFGALLEARAALEMVEQEHGRMEQERFRLRDRLDGLLTSLRQGAVLLLFDADGELAGAEGAFDDHLGISLSDLVQSFDEFAGDETRQSLEDANHEVMALDSSGAAISRSFLRSGDNRVGLTWIHLRRHDDDENLIGTEVIGLVSPVSGVDEDPAGAEDPFESVMQQVARRLIDDSRDSTIRRVTESFGSSLSVDRVTINRYEEKDRTFSIMSSWLRGETEPLAAETRGISISQLPWAYSLLGAGEAVVVSEHADLPPEARAEKRIYASDGVMASLLVPMVRGDHLFGFVSIQSARQHRDWSPADRAKASGFVRLLSATLARAAVEGELAEARGEAEVAAESTKGAEARAEEAEDRAKETAEMLEALTSEADEAKRRVEELEKDIEKAHEAEQKARATADEERGHADDVRKETEELRKEAQGLREEADDLREEAEGLRRQAEELREKAANAVREADELKADAERAREQAKEARDDSERTRERSKEAPKRAHEERGQAERMFRDVAVARDEARDLRPVDRAASDSGRRATAQLASLDDYDSEATAEIVGQVGRNFDPDATLEMEFSGLGKRGRSSALGLASKIATLQDAEAAIEAPSPTRLDERDEGVSRASDLDDALELSGNGRGLQPTGKESGETSWVDRPAEMAPPRWLLEDVDEEADGGEDVDLDDDRDDNDLDDDEASDVEREVAAARTVARRAAGRDGGRDEHDWWGVGVGDSFQKDVEAADGEADADEADDEDIVVETAWGRRDTSADEIAELDTGPPTQSAAFVDEADGEADEDELPARVDLHDLEEIDAEIGLQDVGGNVELYRSLLTKFRNDYIGAAAKIDNAIQKGNIEVAHLLLHAIKGVSGILGAMPLRETADVLETRLIGGDPGATRVAVDAFTQALKRALDSIATLDAAPPAGVAATEETSIAWGADDDESDDDGDAEDDAGDEPGLPVSDAMVLRSYLSGLRQHLLAEKPRQCQLVMREIEARRWPPGFDARVRDLGELIDDGGFAAARDVFEELMDMFIDD